MDIMNFLSIDCSTDTGSLFVKVKNKTFSKILQSDKPNNDLLMKQILDFFEENNQSLDNISEILVNQGPGNFSGLRSSLAVAKGVSLAKNLKLSGYNTFIWSCAKYFDKEDPIYSLIEFKKRYFIKRFDKNLKSHSKIREISEEIIIRKYSSKFLVVPKNMSKQFSKKILELNNISIVNLDHDKLEFLELKGLLDKNLIKPIYLS